jgi:hypothetical protein
MGARFIMTIKKVVTLSLCVLGTSAVCLAKRISPADLRDANRAALNRLTVGMPRESVVALLGTEEVKASAFFEGIKVITNPFRTETLLSGDGSKTFEVLFYYTSEDQASDITITERDLTPLVVEDGKLKGWGWTFVKQIAKLYDIDVRIDEAK